MRTVTSYLIGIFSLLCSCSNEELLEKYEAPVPIRLSTQCIEVDTKTTGAISQNVLPENTQISIFSIEHPSGEVPAAWTPGVFDNTLGITDAVGDISYNNTYYFPIGNQLDFYAVHPTLSDMGVTYSGQEEIKVSLNENADAQYDLMYASLLRQSKKTEKLVFKFSHLLSQIQFTISKSGAATVSLPLTQIEITAPGRGIFNLWKGTLTPINGSETSFTLTTQLEVTDTPTIAGEFLLFPQIPTEFILTFGNDGTETYHVATSSEPSLWEAGINYQYHIVINRDIPTQTVSPVENADNATLPDNADTPEAGGNSGNNEEAFNSSETETQDSETEAITKAKIPIQSVTIYLN